VIKTGEHMKRIRRIRRSELPHDTVELARFLIGKTIVHDLPRVRLSGRIVETEGYIPGDAACHAFNGPTPRNRTLFLEHGRAYVYFVYGAHYMLNVSSEQHGIGAGILLRAIEPLEGIEAMKRHRRTSRLEDLARGPGRLASALRISPRLDGLDLCERGPLWLGAPVRPAGPIGVSVRIGISKDAHRMLRFYERENPFVSGPKRLRI
jgi:DNA-3-methyladenine glycosylase